MTALRVALAACALALLFIAIRMNRGSPTSRRFRSLVYRFALIDAIARLQFCLSKRMRVFMRYWVAVEGLARAAGVREYFERTFLVGRDPETVAFVRSSDEYAEVNDYYERKLAECRTYFATMTDNDIRQVSAVFCESQLENLVPEETLVEFYRGERDTIAKIPHMIVGHKARLGERLMRLRERSLSSSDDE